MTEAATGNEAGLAAEVVHRVSVLLQARLGRAVRHVEVFARGEGLVLQGRVATYYAKQLAQHLALDHCGAACIINDIEVQ